MKKKNSMIGKYVFYTVIGLLVLATGAVLAKMMRDTAGWYEAIPYIMIGIGAGIFGQNSGSLIKMLSLKDNPEIAEQMEIEENDERNVLIRDKARAKSYQLMIFVYGALMLAFGIMKVSTVIVISMAAAYLFIIGMSVFYYNQLQKKM